MKKFKKYAVKEKKKESFYYEKEQLRRNICLSQYDKYTMILIKIEII